MFVCLVYHNKIPQTAWLIQSELIFSQFWRLWVQDHGFGRVWFLVRIFFLSCTSCGLSVHTWWERVGLISGVSCKDANPMRLEFYLYEPQLLLYFIYSHTEGYWLHHVNFRGSQTFSYQHQPKSVHFAYILGILADKPKAKFAGLTFAFWNLNSKMKILHIVLQD